MKSLLSIMCAFLSVGLWAQDASDSPQVTVIEHRGDSTHVVNTEVVPASYIGGYKELYAFLEGQLVYPNKAKEEQLEGVVFLTLTLSSTGEVMDVEVLRGIGSGCDEEAMRLARLMPAWNPGLINGEAAVSEYRLPIRFRL